MNLNWLTCIWLGVLMSVDCALGEKCKNKTSTLFAEFQPKTIFSSGYPENYEINDDCGWDIGAVVQDGNYAIQLVVLEMDISDYNSECNTDYILVYEGTASNPGKELGKLCGSEKTVLKSVARSITLRFHSDGHITGKGFILQYNLIKFSPAECREGEPVVIEVGNQPLYELFKSTPDNPLCEWKLQASDPSEYLVIQLFSPSDLSCVNGQYTLYEGEKDVDRPTFDWCSKPNPFSEMYLASSTAILVSDVHGGSEQTLVLKLFSRTATVNCDDQSMPAIEVGSAPVIFFMPLYTHTDGTLCPVRVWNRHEKFLRVDAMGVDGGYISCGAELVDVKPAANAGRIIKGCNRQTNPVYHQEGSELIITPVSETKVFMRATGLNYKSNGILLSERAYADFIREEFIPQKGLYDDLTKSVLLLEAQEENQAIHMTIDWQLPLMSPKSRFSNSTVCAGDFINVYDGDSESSPLLFTSCKQPKDVDRILEQSLVSTQNKMLLIFDADKHINTYSMKIKFFAVPGRSYCKERQAIVVDQRRQTITSPNYPNKYPLNQMCFYELTSSDLEKDIMVEVLEATLPSLCGDLLVVYKETNEMMKSNIVGRVCGSDVGQVFRVPARTGLLYFHSNDESFPGNWKVQVFLADKGSNSAGWRQEQTLTRVAGFMVVIPLVFILHFPLQ